MKMKNIAILETSNFLQTLADKKLPLKISFGIIKNSSIYSKEQTVYQDALKKIIEKYNDYTMKDEDGNPQYEQNGLPKVDDEHVADYYNEVNELLNIEVDIEPYYIDESAFNYDDDKYDVLSTRELAGLMSVMVAPEA